MNKLIKDELKSNVLRYTNKNYSYESMIKQALNSNMALVISVILMNLLIISASIIVDAIDLGLQIPYWWSLLIRTPLVVFALLNFQVWKHELLRFADFLFILCSLFVPIWSIFLIIYLIFRTFLETMLHE